MGDSLQSIEYSCISKFVLIQHIFSIQVSDIGPVVLWFVPSKVYLEEVYLGGPKLNYHTARLGAPVPYMQTV